METSFRRLSRRVVVAVAVIAAGWATSACTDLVADSPLENSRRTPEALAEAGLAALTAGDEEALEELLIGREEYETVVWPLLPDGEYVDFDFVWGMSAPRNRKALRNLVADYRSVPMELISVELGDEIEAYEGLVLYKEARMTVRRTDTGAEGILPMMDVLVHMGGGWKFMNFRDDT
jgi:hypothetical protein